MKIIRDTLFIFLCFSVSCTKNNDLTGECKVVLKALAGNHGVEAVVYLTQPLDVLEMEMIDNAEVWLFEDGMEVSRLHLSETTWTDYFSDHALHYTCNYRCAPGHIYRLEARVPGYSPVWGETEMPAAVPFEITGVHFQEDSANYLVSKCLVLHVTINDPPFTANYYDLRGKGPEKRNGDGIEYIYSMANQTDPVFNRYYHRQGQLLMVRFNFDDVLFNGRQYTVNFKFQRYYLYNPDSVFFELYLTSLSESYYRYNDTWINQYNQRNDMFSEPIQVYCNIHGGLGFFGARNTFTDSVICKRIIDEQWIIENFRTEK